MASFLGKQKVTNTIIHEQAKDTYELIELLDLKINKHNAIIPLRKMIEDTIRMEGVLSKSGELQIFSPLFDLRLLSETLDEFVDQNTIYHIEGEIEKSDIDNIIWGQFFKNILLSIDGSNDIAKIQSRLKVIFPADFCKFIFNKNKLSQADVAILIGRTRGAITHSKQKKIQNDVLNDAISRLIDGDDYCE